MIGLAGIAAGNDGNNPLTVVHEFGHLYGAPDHYAGTTKSTEEINREYGSELFERKCIYGEDRLQSEVANGLIICAGCRAEIMKNRNRYKHY